MLVRGSCRPLAGAREQLRVQLRRQLEQHARRRDDGDVLVAPRVEAMQRLHAMDDDAGPPPAAERRDRHLGRRRQAARQQAHHVRRGPVAERRALAAGEHRRHVVGEHRAPGMSDRVDPVVDGV
jgi:hypothetical protein